MVANCALEKEYPMRALSTRYDLTGRDVSSVRFWSNSGDCAHEAHIRRLVDANVVGIVTWNLDGRILEANDAFLRMLGYERADLVSGRLRWTEFMAAHWRGRALQVGRQC